MPGWFALVMGLCGLSLAWHRANGVLGEMADGLALVIGALAALVVSGAARPVGPALAALPRRAGRRPQHPVRHAFVAAFPVSLLLLATVGVALGGAADRWGRCCDALWWAAAWPALGHRLGARPLACAGRAARAGAGTPALAVGHAGAADPGGGKRGGAAGGVPLGHEVWSAMQFGIGAFLWPVAMALILARRIAHSPVPERVLPAWFITIAPPAVIGWCFCNWQAPRRW